MNRKLTFLLIVACLLCQSVTAFAQKKDKQTSEVIQLLKKYDEYWNKERCGGGWQNLGFRLRLFHLDGRCLVAAADPGFIEFAEIQSDFRQAPRNKNISNGQHDNYQQSLERQRDIQPRENQRRPALRFGFCPRRKK